MPHRFFMIGYARKAKMEERIGMMGVSKSSPVPPLVFGTEEVGGRVVGCVILDDAVEVELVW